MLRRLRSRFGISAPRVAIRTHIPWYWRAGATVVLLALALALAGWIYDAGRSFAGFDSRESEQQLSDLRGRLVELQDEAMRLHDIANASESRLQMEHAAQQALSEQVKVLEAENSRLKEDLAVFEHLATGDTKTMGIGIQRLQVETDGAKGGYRYRMLLSAPGLPKDKAFQGRLQLVATVVSGGKTVMLSIPQAGEPDSQKYLIAFKHFRRIEGVFQLPPDVAVKQVEARLLQNGSVIASQQVSL